MDSEDDSEDEMDMDSEDEMDMDSEEDEEKPKEKKLKKRFAHDHLLDAMKNHEYMLKRMRDV